MKIIPLDSDDDITSICDRLDWAGESQALLVLPEDGGVLREGLDLVRLRRHADRRRLDVGLVTAVPDITRQAKALGLPVFISVETAEHSRRGWWRGRRRAEVVGLPTVGGVKAEELRPAQIDEGDRQEARRRLAPVSSPRLWIFRYAAILLFFMVVAAVFVAVSYAVPGATVRLRPDVLPIEITKQIVADPALEEVDYGRSAVPARILSANQSWQAGAETSGVAEVPSASARGKVVFVNRQAQEVVAPAGTRVRTSAGSTIVFQTLNEAIVPGVEGGTAEVEVVAVEPGPQGNVAANQVNEIEGTLALQLEVRNLEAIEGGGVREEKAVTSADQERLRAQVLQFLQAVSASEMEAQTTPFEFLARDSVRVVSVNSETYSHFPGEQTDRLALEMRADVVGTAVNANAASGIVYEALATAVPDGYVLVPNSIKYTRGDVVAVDEAGRVTFEMTGEVLAAADLELEQVLNDISGQPPDLAIAYLFEQLPLRAVPEVAIWPNWFNRLPYVPARIRTIVNPVD
ncbi:MAG: baseplate J/gp47 family protein [Chloroflexi bacterium]|nr:baseplate J/gp47 family protein [Chloroflexota bacterium]MBP7044364.1 baseplate J/gp47 family protein [Chloroflexota bacterium]